MRSHERPLLALFGACVSLIEELVLVIKLSLNADRSFLILWRKGIGVSVSAVSAHFSFWSRFCAGAVLFHLFCGSCSCCPQAGDVFG